MALVSSQFQNLKELSVTNKNNQLTEQEKQTWNDAIDAVLELLRIHPPSRIGEAAFMRRLFNLKQR
ncbi:MAG: hypothetical protein RL563_2662 [Pseudomonadota bacterium]|jgi:hypothetical protein